MGMKGLDFQRWTWGMPSCLFELLPPFVIWRSSSSVFVGDGGASGEQKKKGAGYRGMHMRALLPGKGAP